MATALFLLFLALRGTISFAIEDPQINNTKSLEEEFTRRGGLSPRADVAVDGKPHVEGQANGELLPRTARLKRIGEEDYFGMPMYKMDNMPMPMYPRGYFYPHMMAPTLPPYNGRRDFEVEVNPRRKVVPHPRLVEAPHLSTEINSISVDPELEYERESGPYERGRPAVSRKRNQEKFEPVFFDDENSSARRLYMSRGSGRLRKRPSLRYKPSPYMTNGHRGAFEDPPSREYLVAKRRQGEDEEEENDGDARYGLLQSDKKKEERRKFLPAPSLRVPEEEGNERGEDDPPSASMTHKIDEGYRPPYRTFVLGPAGYQLAEAGANTDSVSVPARVEHVPLVGETRRRLISYAGAKEYFEDESEDYVPIGLKPVTERINSASKIEGKE